MLSGNIYIVCMGLDYTLRIECSLHKEHGWSKSMRMHSETSIKGNTSPQRSIRERAEFEIPIFPTLPSSLAQRQSRTTQKFIRFKNKVLVSSHPRLYSGFHSGFYSVPFPSIVDERNVFLQEISNFCWVKGLPFCRCH